MTSSVIKLIALIFLKFFHLFFQLRHFSLRRFSASLESLVQRLHRRVAFHPIHDGLKQTQNVDQHNSNNRSWHSYGTAFQSGEQKEEKKSYDMIARRHRHTMTRTTLQRYLTVDQRRRREWIFDHPHLKYLFATCGAVVHGQRSREHSTLMRKSVWPAFCFVECEMTIFPLKWWHESNEQRRGRLFGTQAERRKNVNTSWVLGEKKVH